MKLAKSDVRTLPAAFSQKASIGTVSDHMRPQGTIIPARRDLSNDVQILSCNGEARQGKRTVIGYLDEEADIPFCKCSNHTMAQAERSAITCEASY